MPKHVLLVEDDALLRRSLAFSLEQAGYRMTSSALAEDALALSRREPPDLVLPDIGLPGIDGLETLRHFRETVGAPVIFLLVDVFLSDSFTGLAVPTALAFGIKVLFILLALSVAGVLYARLRIDQLVGLGWRVLAPLALVQLLVVIWIGVG